MTTLRYKLLADVPPPAYQTAGASGIDLCCADLFSVRCGQTVKVATGLCVEIPQGFEGQIRPRSSLSAEGILVHFGTIDSDYRGEISVVVTYLPSGDAMDVLQVPLVFMRGTRIAQLVIAPVERVELVRVEQLSETARGAGGFGHTGKR